MCYPAQISEALKSRSEHVCRRILKQAGLDNGCFDMEFLYDQEQDRLWVIEVSTRMLQSHSELFYKVDGMSDHEVAVSVALGRKPHLPDHKGRFETAGKCWLKKIDDAEVTPIPRPEEIDALAQELREALIVPEVEEGDRLSALEGQGKYSYTVGSAWLGADSEDELKAKHKRLVEKLPLKFSDGRGPSY